VPGPYEIYVIRHGVAEERGEAWPDDTKRPLTADGVSRLRKVARGLINLGVAFDVVLTSPLVRAKQTADAIAGAFDARPPIVTIDSLSPGSSYASLLLDLEKQSRRSRIALVGHEPGIGEFAARLAGSRHPFELKKGAVCRVDIETLPPAGSGALRWFLTPKILRAIKR
jgi:phosphohistidine phosphatase